MCHVEVRAADSEHRLVSRMSTEISRQEFRVAAGVDDWRLLFDGANAFYRTR